MAKLVTWLLFAIFAAIVLYYMFTVAYDVASPNTYETIDFEANYTWYPTTYEIVTVTGVQNNTYLVPASNQSWNSTHVLLNMGDAMDVGEYTVFYDTPAASTVWGMDLAFIGILVIIGVGFAIAARTWK